MIVSDHRSSTVATQVVDVAGTLFAFRELGPRGGTPLVLLPHPAAVLDEWDPRLLDGLAGRRHVITFDNRGVGGSGGTTPGTVREMAADAARFARALGHERVDLLGLSLGGVVAQQLAIDEPRLVRRLVLAGTGLTTAGEPARLAVAALLAPPAPTPAGRAARHALLFPRTTAGRAAARDHTARLAERTGDLDAPISAQARNAQALAIAALDRGGRPDPRAVAQPAFLVNGGDDAQVPVSQSLALTAAIPRCRLRILAGSGHGAIFQHHDRVVPAALQFLEASA